MEFLKSKLPKSIKVIDKEYQIKTDFRSWIKFELIVSDSKVSESIKAYVLFNLIFIDDLVIDTKEKYESAVNALFYFYKLNKEAKSNTEVSDDVAYHYDHDWNLIYAAFMDTYNIDLYDCELHWWQYKPLFDCLDTNTTFMKIVGYRTTDLNDIKDKDRKKEYKKLKEEYALNIDKKQRRSAKEIEEELLKKVGG